MPDILAVFTDNADRSRIVQVLAAAGHNVSSASTFEEAKRMLTVMSPDVVMTDERLGAYNGLHVILNARLENPHVRAMLITPVLDRGLQADAARLNVECIVNQYDPEKWLAIGSKTLDADGGFAGPEYLPSANWSEPALSTHRTS
jgi:DNA-binding NtrC family response regulator